MPSVFIGNRSGGQPLFSGNLLSGRTSFEGKFPQAGVQLRWDRNASGYAYVGLSGGVTVNSGGVLQSGTTWVGGMDGMQMGPGDSYWIPRTGLGIQSGDFNVFVLCDAGASGQGRMYFEIY